jgi:hypothetical protein
MNIYRYIYTYSIFIYIYIYIYIGFGGWYTGKTNGKIGTTNVHRQPSIAIADPAHSWTG